MNALAWQMPAWALTLMPVRFARQCLNERASTAATATAQTRARQLLVDVSVIHQSDARTGIQRVVRALLLQLLMAPPAGYRVRPIFATRQHGYRYANTDFLHSTHQTSGAAVSSMLVDVMTDVHAGCGDLFLGLDLAAHLLPRHQAQVLRWKRSGVKMHVVVYDLLPLRHPEWFNPKTVRNFKRWIQWLGIYADSAICISESVKMELHAWLNTHFGMPPKIFPASTIVLGADIDASAPTGGLPAQASSMLLRLRSSTAVLMVGTLEPRKGYDQALAAFEQLWLQGDATLLVIVGRPGWKTQALQKKLRRHPQTGQRLFWLEDVSDEYLAQLYDACSGVLVASRGEGFGLPLIEAALHNKPLLARDLSVFREIALPDVTFFSGENAASLAASISAWLQKASCEGGADQNQSVSTWQTAAEQLFSSLGLTGELCLKANVACVAQATEQGVTA
ncbi:MULTISPECIES: glycosyltransferase family 1 protein [Comamonas]|uniref:glycosyltransferase family 4 protein n=1 Tax=Comamonas TaxID=283 RepID=UPI000AD7B043|nr:MULTISPECIES: glycosyltransferase family 1 protein [Comamonas]MDN5536197.1 glycosyltransferase family 4 protein [Comamonas sp.]